MSLSEGVQFMNEYVYAIVGWLLIYVWIAFSFWIF
jgi:hypothetical protein